MKKGAKNETEIEMLARTVAEGFEQMNDRFDAVDKRLESVDARFDSVESRLFSLEKGQAETNRRLDSIEKKQEGMLLSLDEAVHQSEFKALVRRVELLEK